MVRQPKVHGAKVTRVSKRRPRGARRVALLATLAASAAAACASGADDRGLEALETPTFAPERPSEPTTTTAPTSTTTTTTPPTAPDPTPETTTTSAGAADTDADRTAPVAPDRRVVALEDPIGDAVGGLDHDPPAWSDLAGARLVRDGDAYGLSVRLGGGTVPQRAPDGRTMNVATFFDLDGDGSVDVEIWANLGSQGWGAASYDNTDGTGGFGEDSDVTVVVRERSLELIFPDVLLHRAGRFRFSLASEYGALDVLGSAYARRDDAPDGGGVVTFPG